MGNPVRRFSAVEILALWLTFNVFVASFTILWSICALIFGKIISTNPNHVSDLADVFSHGELLIISVSVTAAALGDFFRSLLSGKLQVDTKIILFACGTFFTMLLSLIGFGFANGNVGIESAGGYAWFSFIIYLIGMIVSANCILLAEV